MYKIVFDIETKNTFDEVGSSDPSALDISLVGLYDYTTNTYEAFVQEDFPRLWPYFEKADIMIGFNSDHFDIPLLNKYYPGDISKIKSIDLMAEIKKSLGRRIGLASIAEATLGYGKSGHGLDAIFWWKNGEIEKIKKYCLDDVKVTRELYEYALQYKKLKYKDAGELKDIPLDTESWEQVQDTGMTWSLPF